MKRDEPASSSVKQNLAYQIVFRVLTILTPLITSPILSRALGAEKLGVYSATLAYVNYFMLFAMLGVENYGNRSIAAARGDKGKLQELFWNIYAVQVIASILAMAVYALSFAFLNSDRYMIAALQGLWLLSNLINVNWFFFGTEQFRLTVARSIIIKLLTVVLIAVLIRRPSNLYVYALIMAGDAVLGSAIMWPFLKKTIDFQIPRWRLMKEHLKPILVLFVPVVAMSVFHIMDKTMLDVLRTETDVGYYYSADKIINIPLAVITALGTVMLPHVSNVMSKGNKGSVALMLKKSFELTMFLACAVGMGIASIANEFVPFFFGAGFEPCILLIYWFVPVLFMKAISDLIRTQYMVPAHQDAKYTIAIVFGAVSNLIANYFLIRMFGALGAVLGTLIAEAVVAAAEIYLARDELPFLRYLVGDLSYILIGIFMIVVVRGVAHVLHAGIVVKLLCMVLSGGAVYILGCLLYWHFKKSSIFHRSDLDRILRRS